jgi:hypothetical protein
LAEWLYEGETIVQTFQDTRPTLHLTDARIATVEQTKTSLVFKDIALEHLTSVSADARANLGLVVIGTVLLLAGLFVSLPFPGSSSVAGLSKIGPYLGLIIVAVGIALIILGILTGWSRVEFEGDSGERLRIRTKSRSQTEEIIRKVRKASHSLIGP